jgi:MEKHLA domain
VTAVRARIWDKPTEQNFYLQEHASRLLVSFTHWTGKSLIETDSPMEEQARRLFYAPFVLLSHNTAPDPILNYANRAALTLFELTWEELVNLPSRKTAEPSEQEERERLLAMVSRQGYIDDYRGVRVAKSGRRFFIHQATVWNLLDDNGTFYGQAAMFRHWKFLD